MLLPLSAALLAFLEARRRGTGGYLCSGDNTSRNDLRRRSLQVARVFPQTAQSSRPSEALTETDSAIKYNDPHLRQVTSEILMTRYSTRVLIVDYCTGA